MSYDVDVAEEWFNITSNLRDFFTDFRVYPPDLDGLRASDVALKISDALEDILAKDPNRLDEYNAYNGWGKWPDGIRFLMEVRGACRRNPTAIVRVSA